MFNSLKRLFGRRVETTVEPGGEHRATTPSMLTLPSGFTPRSAPRGENQPRSFAANIPSTLHIPLKTIIGRLSPELMKRVRQPNVGEVEIPISMQKILAQIAQGAVRLSFGELRQVSPGGTFSDGGEMDRTLVDLPLQEVILRMNLALLPRRPSQKQVEVPPEVTGPFGSQCKVEISTAPLKPLPPTPPRIQAPAPLTPPTPAPMAPPITRAQPVVARIRNGAPPPLEPAAPALTPSREASEPAPAINPIFNRAGNVAPLPPVAPVVTPIAPDPAPSVPIPMPEVLRSASLPSAATPVPAIPEPAAPVAPSAPINLPAAPIRFTPPPPPPAPDPEVLAAGETRFLTVAISALSAGWPDAIKDEILARGATTSAIGLPYRLVEGALKSGKIAYKWKTLRAWMKPPQPASSSPRDATVLELPLRVIAPLFLNELNAAKPQSRVEVDEDIPDLFFDGTRSVEGAPEDSAQPTPTATRAPAVAPPSRPPTPAPFAPPPAPQRQAAPMPPARSVTPAPAPQANPAPATPKPTPKPARMTPLVPDEAFAPIFTATPPKSQSHEDTNFFNRADKEKSQEPEPAEDPVFLRKDGTPGTDFLKRYATPNDIVKKAASLRGVDGALIGLPDGLLVACKIPPSMNADTIAAFLPQIFTKVSQCTRELRLGELNNLNFTVGTVPWKIFKVGAIYFAAFGRAGEAMPTAQLAVLAAELDHKAK
jgi:predicted regulator of Ras-like GTPase activity (Roadblock/LC7/MglB family)